MRKLNLCCDNSFIIPVLDSSLGHFYSNPKLIIFLFYSFRVVENIVHDHAENNLVDPVQNLLYTKRKLNKRSRN